MGIQFLHHYAILLDTEKEWLGRFILLKHAILTIFILLRDGPLNDLCIQLTNQIHNPYYQWCWNSPQFSIRNYKQVVEFYPWWSTHNRSKRAGKHAHHRSLACIALWLISYGNMTLAINTCIKKNILSNTMTIFNQLNKKICVRRWYNKNSTCFE